MRTRMIVLASALGALTAGVVAGCADSRPVSASSAPVALTSAGVATSASAPARISATPADPSPSRASHSQPATPAAPKPTGKLSQQTLVGQVTAGVEPGCLVLRDSTGTYQLMGGDPTVVYAGARVTVTGHVVTGMMSYCMQGKPFQIVQASPRH